MTPKEYFEFVCTTIYAVSSSETSEPSDEDLDSFNASLYPDDIFNEEELTEYNRLVDQRLEEMEEERRSLIQFLKDKFGVTYKEK